MALQICFITAEMTPFAKAGGLADVSGALVKYLHAAGHDIRLFMPGYSSIARSALEIYPVEFLQDVPLRIGTLEFRFSVQTARLPGSQAMVYLIDCPVMYSRGALYTNDPDEYRRFLLLTHAAFISCQRMGFAPQILHCNDWHTGMGPLWLRTVYHWDALFAKTRSVMTVHNIGYQGLVGAERREELLPVPDKRWLHQEELRAGRINMLRQGLAYADLITTVSPTYALEIQTASFGMGLEAILRARADALVGILNGVDYSEWDPRNDPHLPRVYGPRQLGIKAELKAQFLAEIGLESAERRPLVGIVSRLATQKGFDLLLEALPALLATRDFSLAVLGAGEARYEEFFTTLAHAHPRRVFFHRGYSDERAHWIEAASDMFLMPSQYEPCGLNQMYSLRYGTVPIVRRTGGLADSVQPFDAAKGSGTGIVFEHYNVTGVLWAVNTAIDLYASKSSWRRVVQNGMAMDYSWSHQVGYYIEQYRRLAGD
jgi:starch synthase